LEGEKVYKKVRKEKKVVEGGTKGKKSEGKVLIRSKRV
jgi:hypothetical protein